MKPEDELQLIDDLRWWANNQVAKPGAVMTPWQDGLVRLLREAAHAIEDHRKPPPVPYTPAPRDVRWWAMMA